MKFNRNISIMFFVSVCFLFSLQGKEQVVINDQEIVPPNADFVDPKVLTQQFEDSLAFYNLMEPLNNVLSDYDEKNEYDFEIVCKKCKEGSVPFSQFSGHLLAWALKAFPDGHDAFENVKKLVEQFITLLTKNASEEELTTFMVETTNSLKFACQHCHGEVWEKEE
jgi:hypothetical protein